MKPLAPALAINVILINMYMAASVLSGNTHQPVGFMLGVFAGSSLLAALFVILLALIFRRKSSTTIRSIAAFVLSFSFFFVWVFLLAVSRSLLKGEPIEILPFAQFAALSILNVYYFSALIMAFFNFLMLRAIPGRDAPNPPVAQASPEALAKVDETTSAGPEKPDDA